MRLFIHIGHAKSGSTTLQSFLFHNWERLRQQGIELPTPNFGLATRTSPPGNLLNHLIKLKESGDNNAIFNWINDVTSTYPKAHSLVLSSEVLMNPGYARLFRGLARRLPVHLVYYLRRQDELLPSAWRQWGHKRGLSLDELIRRRIRHTNPNFAQVIDEWRYFLEPTTCHIRFINPGFLENGRLTEDFATHIGAHMGELEDVANMNVARDARLLHFLAQHPTLYSSMHDETILTLLSSAGQDEPVMRVKLTPEQFSAIQNHFEPSNQAILKQFHPACAGMPVIDPETAPVARPEDNLTDESVLAFIKDRLTRMDHMQHPALDQLRKIIGA